LVLVFQCLVEVVIEVVDTVQADWTPGAQLTEQEVVSAPHSSAFMYFVFSIADKRL